MVFSFSIWFFYVNFHVETHFIMIIIIVVVVNFILFFWGGGMWVKSDAKGDNFAFKVVEIRVRTKYHLKARGAYFFRTITRATIGLIVFKPAAMPL